MYVGQLRDHDYDHDVWMEPAWEDEAIDHSYIAALGKGKGAMKGKGKGKSAGKSVPSHMQCFSCGQFGHFASSCPYAKSKGKGKPVTIPTCWACGNSGHVQRDCPYLRQSPWSSMPQYMSHFPSKGKGKGMPKGKGKGAYEVHAQAEDDVNEHDQFETFDHAHDENP